MPNLKSWRGGTKHIEFLKLIKAIKRKIVHEHGSTDLGSPRKNEKITDAHLALVHTCWRSEKYDESFGGVKMYRWDLIVYGSNKALDLIEHVIYYLHPAYEIPPEGNYPGSHSIERKLRVPDRKDNFLLKQLANGHSLVRADIKIKGQIDLVKLTRYINLFDSDYKVNDMV